MVFQNYALYPHMSVYENMAFSLRTIHMPNDQIHEKVMEAAEILGITEYLERKPKALSGGQRQRVALGRAIVRQPKVFLLDEPLSNLDAKLRAAMRAEISRLHEKLGTTFIYVTHDQVEAMTMGSRIVVMKDGFVQQIDTPINLYKYPDNMFVAGFIGTPQMNFFDGKIENGCYVTKDFSFELDEKRKELLRNYEGKGFTPEAIKGFILDTGLSRTNSTTNYEMLEHFLREDLKLKSARMMAVVNPLKVVITNYPEGEVEYVDAENNAENEAMGSRKIPFGRVVYIEKDDFLEEKPNKKWKRLSLGLEVRLMHAYFIKCNEVIKDENGEIIELHCTYDPATKSGSGFDERKPNGTIHFVEASHAIPTTFNIFEPLINEGPEYDDLDLFEKLNENSWTKYEGFVEEALATTSPLDHYQFVRLGYYTTDKESTKEHLVFNQTCALKSSFNK
mgnify:CR=1 FL=1